LNALGRLKGKHLVVRNRFARHQEQKEPGRRAVEVPKRRVGLQRRHRRHGKGEDFELLKQAHEYQVERLRRHARRHAWEGVLGQKGAINDDKLLVNRQRASMS